MNGDAGVQFALSNLSLNDTNETLKLTRVLSLPQVTLTAGSRAALSCRRR